MYNKVNGILFSTDNLFHFLDCNVNFYMTWVLQHALIVKDAVSHRKPILHAQFLKPYTDLYPTLSPSVIYRTLSHNSIQKYLNQTILVTFLT